MKSDIRTLIVLLCMAVSPIMQVQAITDTFPEYRGFLVGINGAVYSHIIANQNNYGQKEMDYDGLQFSGTFGPQIGYSFNRQWQLRTGVHVNQSMGQHYADHFNDKNNYKEVNFTYTYVPLLARWVLLGKKEVRRTGKGRISSLPPAENESEVNNTSRKDHHLFLSFGPQFGWLTDEHYVFQHDGSDVALLQFLIDAGVNPHQSELINRLSAGDNAEELELYRSLDLQWVLGVGWQKYITGQFLFSAVFRGGISMLDINSEDWQYENREMEYGPSRNAFGGLFVSLEYIF